MTDPTLLERATAAFNKVLDKLDAPILDEKPSSTLQTLLGAVDFASSMTIRSEGDVDRFTMSLLNACVRMATELKPEKVYAYNTEVFANHVRVGATCFETVVGADGSQKNHRALISLENRTPSVSGKYLELLEDLGKGRGFLINFQTLGGDFKGPASIAGKLGSYMTDLAFPHRFGILSDGVHFRYFWHVPSNSPEEKLFLLSHKVPYTDEKMYPLFLLPLLDPTADLSPPTLPNPSHPSVSTHAPTATPHIMMLGTGGEFMAGQVAFCTTEPLLPSSPLLTAKPTFHGWATSASQNDVFIGTMGDLKVVLKVGYPEPVDGPRSQMALWAEADIYTERLEGIEGVPKLLAKGWLEVFAGQWYPALLMESLGDPIPELDVEDLSPEDKAELDHLQTQLLERGVIHYDVEARNIVRRPNHRLGLVDFGDVVLK